jgi:integrase/recombinase XerD
MQKFREYLVIKGYSSATVRTIIKAVEYFITWCEKENISDVAGVSHNDITAYVQHYNIRGTGRKTTAHYIMHLRKYFDYLISENEVHDNPCSNIKIRGIKRKTLYEILSMEELEKLYHGYATDIIIERSDTLKNPPPMQVQTLARKRNKIILGLLIYQAVRSEEIMRLQVGDAKLREGKIFIAGAKRSNERTMKLESGQVFDLLDYINDTRKQTLHHKGITIPTQQLFFNIGNSERPTNFLHMLLAHLKQVNGKIKNLDQVRASVITHWLKLHNLRKVQYMAGHRYISSTESYKANNLDGLKEDIAKFHPF